MHAGRPGVLWCKYTCRTCVNESVFTKVSYKWMLKDMYWNIRYSEVHNSVQSHHLVSHAHAVMTPNRPLAELVEFVVFLAVRFKTANRWIICQD